MTPLYLLTDYKNRFGLKWEASPYRSGYDHASLPECFAKHGYSVEYVPLSEVFSRSNPWKGKLVLYTSCEEIGDNYKSYIEDIVYGLEEAGAHLLPRAAFLRAHNNKTFMETLRGQLLGEELTGLQTRPFGAIEEFEAAIEAGEIAMPCVLKSAAGAMSRGVTLAHTNEEAIKEAKRLSRTPHIRYEIRDYLRSLKIPGYRRESRYQGKFVVQPLIPDLTADWKVLVYGDQYYVLKRHIRPGDFRASGSHLNYLPGRRSEIPDIALGLVEKIYNKLNVPHLSVDVAFDGKRPYLFEFQAIHFGTSTQVLCEEYHTRQEDEWVVQQKTFGQEEVFAWSIAHYLSRHPELVAP